MRNGSNRVLDELAKLMTDAAGVVQDVRCEAETIFHTQVEKIINKLDLVSREEFEVVKEMVSKLYAENADLKNSLNNLEKQSYKRPKAASTKSRSSQKK
ncbi:accessory factor UbiK family protein [Bartonella ancashensis]|uniref:Pyrroline-5-carboxylate reductase n=1 Tax=Bartonella ancashensis TaxID=1318743 RepID=A0A0M4LIP3_9HYPH|nr:accessory factor UbiK family protein [Bartonella ancashensis]ALE03580.1 hypothetical protein PU02_0766 [Bartonella ancashensis]